MAAPPKAGVLTVSDKGYQGQRADASGPAARDFLASLGIAVEKYAVVPDEKDAIIERLTAWAGELDLIVTSGGTGLGPRDVTPEATLAVVERVAPGLAEAMRAEGSRTTPLAALSRGVAGVRGRCLIINLPGSPKAVRESLEVLRPILPHALGVLRGEVGEHPGG